MPHNLQPVPQQPQSDETFIPGVPNFCSSEDGVIHFNVGAAGATPVTGRATVCTGSAYPVLQYRR